MTGRRVRPLVSLLVAAGLLHLVLVQPNHPGAATWQALTLFALELPALLALFAVLPPRRHALVRGGLVGILLALAALKAADLGFVVAFNRGFDLVTDGALLWSGWQLASGALGLPLALLAAVAGVAMLAAVAASLWWALGQWTGVARGRGGSVVALTAVVGITAAGLAVADVGQTMGVWRLAVEIPGDAFTARTAAERVVRVRRSLDELAQFRTAARTDPLAGLPSPLARLEGRDVIVVFVESYGRASLDNPLYAQTHQPILHHGDRQIAAAGLGSRSGWLTSPIEGGQSWLAHATLASGLRIDNGTRYGALLSSGRSTLWHIAAEAGYLTAAVSPAITLPWPEAATLGFEVRLDRDAMGYAGRPFNWITMPDQFTLARFLDRLPPDPRPLFAQISLISSHAPWVPVPDVLSWDRIDSGGVFDAMAERGDPPEVVWRDPDRIRSAYRDALAYSLTVVFDWAAQQGSGPEAPLILILGDHPAAGFVSQTTSRDVPVHLIGPPDVLALMDAWGWTAGLTPGPAGPVWPMETFRDRFLAAVSGAAVELP